MFTRVPEDMAYVVERLGRYRCTLTSGSHLLMPVIDQVRFRHSLLPRRGEIADTAISYDNLPVRITSTFRWRIVDPQKASYDVASVDEYMTGVVKTRQREWLGSHAWKDIRETTRQLEADVARAAGEDAARVGAEILDVSVVSVGISAVSS